MTSVRHNLEARSAPCAVQVEARDSRRDDIIATLHDHAWQPGELVRIAQHLPLLEEGVVYEVMRLDAGEGEHVLFVGRVDMGPWHQRHHARLPGAPGACC